MKTSLLLCLASALCATAQESKPIDIEARRESVVTLGQHLEMRQQRLDEVSAEIRESGKKIDQQIGRLVTMLTGIKDSQDSKRAISQVKAEAIGGLKRMIQTYQVERRTITERLRSSSSAPADALNKDLDTIDKLVDKRAADIVALIKSVPGGEDIAKYESAGGNYNGRFYEEDTQISEAWRQNRRDKVQSDKGRREAREALEKAITDLGERQSSLAAALKASGITDAEKEIQSQELARVESLIQQRKTQLIEISTPSAPPSETASSEEASDLKSLFSDARSDIAAEFQKTLRLYRAAAAEREKIHAVELNLEARKKWLAENDPAAKKAQ